MASGDRRSDNGKSCHPLVPRLCGHEPAENRQRCGADPQGNFVKLIIPRLFVINLTCTVLSLFLDSFIIHSERSPDAQNSTSDTTRPHRTDFTGSISIRGGQWTRCNRLPLQSGVPSGSRGYAARKSRSARPPTNGCRTTSMQLSPGPVIFPSTHNPSWNVALAL